MIVHTPTIEDYREVVGFILDNGFTWCSGRTGIFEVFWESYLDKDEMCIIVNNYGTISYASKYYIINNYKEPILNKYEFYHEFYKENNREFIEKHGLI